MAQGKMLLLLSLALPVLAGIFQFLVRGSVSDEVTQITATNITTVTEAGPQLDPIFPRQEQEKTALHYRFQRGTGKWDAAHPRYRLLSALHGFSRYRERNMASVKQWRDFYKQVPKGQRSVIESVIKYTRKLNTVEHLLETNDEIAGGIVNHGLEFYNISVSELDEFIKDVEKQGKSADKTSVNQVMKHYVRDWSSEGGHERVSFDCVLDSLSIERDARPGQTLKALLPGAGLGRLAYEIDALGFEVTMNEYSSYMALAYRYLTTINSADSHAFHPFIDWWSHHATTADMQRGVSFPDTTLSPSVVLVEGDFTAVFASNAGHYDVIVTFFFIDTARNLMTYLETIHRLLRPGGMWINLGPLLYGTAPFLQLSLDEIMLLSETIGFEFVNVECGKDTVPGLQARSIEVLYGSNRRGLSWNGYKGQFWVARRKE